ncbi:MAG: flagellar export chaperone FliS [Steroidobacteraceae bacterium]
MLPHSKSSRVEFYQSVAAHGGVAAADPQQLILMLLDGALERIAAARGAIERGQVADKARLVHRVIAILDELKASLNHDAGGALSQNLDQLYGYVQRQLLRGSAENRQELLAESIALLQEIRAAWIALPRDSAPVQNTAR